MFRVRCPASSNNRRICLTLWIGDLVCKIQKGRRNTVGQAGTYRFGKAIHGPLTVLRPFFNFNGMRMKGNSRCKMFKFLSRFSLAIFSSPCPMVVSKVGDVDTSPRASVHSYMPITGYDLKIFTANNLR